MDGSTVSSVTEQETIYILFICGGVPVLKYFSIESVKVANSAGLKETLEKAFLRFGFKNYYDKLVGLNLDGASTNMSRMNGLGKLIRDEAPWVEIVHCFNNRLELAIKDAFTITTFSHIIDEMLTKLYIFIRKARKVSNNLENLMMLTKNQFQGQQKPMGHSGWILNFKLRKEYWEIMGLI